MVSVCFSSIFSVDGAAVCCVTTEETKIRSVSSGNIPWLVQEEKRSKITRRKLPKVLLFSFLRDVLFRFFSAYVFLRG